jgi:hypothetical protein
VYKGLEISQTSSKQQQDYVLASLQALLAFVSSYEALDVVKESDEPMISSQ